MARGHDRGRAAGIHARPDAQRRLHHPGRGAEHQRRADEDVPHPARLRLEDRRSRATSPRSTCPSGTKSRSAPGAGHPGGLDDVHFSRLTSQDVVRHKLVGRIVDAYEKYDSENGTENGSHKDAGGQPADRSESRPRTMSIDVNNESGTEVDEQAILDIARYALARMRIHPLSELSVIVVDTDAMEQLHIQWMDLPGPTDVMSFPMDELRPPAKDDEEPPQGLLGDIVLCPEVAKQQGEEAADAALHGRGAPAPHRPRSAAPARLRPRGDRTRRPRCSASRLPSSTAGGRRRG